MTLKTIKELEKEKQKRELGQCPNCGEKNLVHNIGRLFECNSCEEVWEEIK